MGREIERKFILKDPTIIEKGKILKEEAISQAYLVTGSEQIRIRKAITNDGTYYVWTHKKGKGMSRSENEDYITMTTFEKLAENKVLLKKNRTFLEFNGIVYQIDCFDDFTDDLVEIEFGSEKEANEFVPPEFLGREVTNDKNYSNQNLWLCLSKAKDNQNLKKQYSKHK